MDTKHDGKTESHGIASKAKGSLFTEILPSAKSEVSFEYNYSEEDLAVGGKKKPAVKPESAAAEKAPVEKASAEKAPAEKPAGDPKDAEKELDFSGSKGPALLRGGRSEKNEEEKKRPKKKKAAGKKKAAAEKPQDKSGGKKRSKGEKKKHGGEKDELDTSSVAVARGISHEARRRKQNLHDLLRFGLIVLLIGLLVGAGFLAFRLTTVKKIAVTGSEKYSEEQLLSMSRIHAGDNYFSYNEKELTDAMNSISDIRTVSVTKKLPNKISIVVADILPRAAIEVSSGHYSIISADGYVLSVGETDAGGLTIIRGMSGEGISLNTFINEQSPSIRTSAAIKLLAAIDESDIAGSILAIDLSSSVYVTIELEGNYTIVLGSITTAPECIETAAKAYARFRPVYPNGGEIQVFPGKTTVDFTPAA